MNLYLILSIIFVFLILAFRSFRAINIKKAKALKISEWDENIMAYHEAGHTVVFAELLNKNLLKVVTIVPSENEFGATKAIFSENLNETYSELIKKIAVVLAGRLSEEILLNETTTSAIHDLNEANFLASNMVLQFGMGKNIKFLRIEEEKLKLCSNELKQCIEKDIFFYYRRSFYSCGKNY